MMTAYLGIQGLTSQHFANSTTNDGHSWYRLTGIVILEAFQGEGSDWSRTTVQFEVPIPGIPEGSRFRPIQWAPFLTLSSISNTGPATDAGWAIDDFGLSNTGWPQRVVTVFCDIAVRDSDGFIGRLGYDITLVGDVEQ